MIFSLSAFVKLSLLHSDFKKHIHKFKFNVTVQRLSQITQKPISLKSLRLSLWPDKFYVLCLIAELEHPAECGLCWEHLNFGKICVDIWFWFLILPPFCFHWYHRFKYNDVVWLLLPALLKRLWISVIPLTSAELHWYILPADIVLLSWRSRQFL